MSNYLYNLSNFGGYWSALDNDGVSQKTEFDVGEFPLQIIHERSSGNGFSRSNAGFTRLSISECFDVAKVGDKISVTFMLPDVSNSWGNGAYESYIFYLQNEDGSKQTQCHYYPESDRISLLTSFEGAAWGVGAFDALLDNVVMNTIVKDGKTTGFALTGELLDAIASIQTMPTFVLDASTSNNHTVSITYADYDDLRIEIDTIAHYPIDPTSFMQGYIVGRRLARMRLKLLDDNIDTELIDGILYIKNAKAILANGILEVK
jgi:hypothetical protein